MVVSFLRVGIEEMLHCVVCLASVGRGAGRACCSTVEKVTMVAGEGDAG